MLDLANIHIHMREVFIYLPKTQTQLVQIDIKVYTGVCQKKAK